MGACQGIAGVCAGIGPHCDCWSQWLASLFSDDDVMICISIFFFSHQNFHVPVAFYLESSCVSRTVAALHESGFKQPPSPFVSKNSRIGNEYERSKKVSERMRGGIRSLGWAAS